MRKPLLIVLLSVLLTAAFTAARYAVFAWRLPTAQYGMRAICHEPQVSTLLIGSSMFRKGIYTPAIDANAYLLAYNGNQPAYEALQLEWMLTHGAHIQRVIVDMYPYSAVRPAALSDTRMVMDGDLGYTLDVFRQVGDSSQRSFAAFYKLVVQSNNETFLTFPLTFGMINARYNHGANEADQPGATRDFLETAVAEEMQTLQTELHPAQLAGLRRIIRLCRDHAIPLRFVESPKYHRVYRDEVFAQIMRQYVAFLASEGQQMLLCDATVRLLSPDLQAYFPSESPASASMQGAAMVSCAPYSFPYDDPTLFVDLIHLSGAGCRQFSQIIQQRLFP